ncbi:MAG TPA: serine hydrolase [Xanthobacteraceae bacterium]|nr:serine hydrolase [Xanthobacteraceae bacterium]
MSIRCPTRLFTTALIASLAMLVAVASRAEPDFSIDQIVARHVAAMLETPGGVAIAVRAGGRTRFYNYGMADRSRPVSSDALFNLASVGKVFDTSLLALADQRGELSLDDPVAKHVVELQQGGDVRRITLRQLATHTSGFVLPQDHPPWPQETFTLPQFVAALNGWSSDKDHEPGRQMIYSHAGFVLLHLALERRFGMPYDALMKQRLLDPLGLRSTTLPMVAADVTLYPRGETPAALARRAVQGYSTDGTPAGAPGDVQGYYLWLGTGQMYASARDLAVFLTANLGELPDQAVLQEAMRRAQQGAFPIDERTDQALAWEVHRGQETGPKTGHETIVDKFGGMDNASAYIGLMRERKVGIVILGNRGNMAVWETGRAILSALASR